MRILSVVRSLEVAAGGSTAAASSIRGLVEQFAETDLIGLGFREKSDKGVIMFSAARLLGRFGWSNSMRRWLRSNICSYDLVFINSIFDWTAISAANAARKAGVPYLIWPHNSLDPYDLRQHSLMKKALATVYWEPLIRNSAGIIFTIEREASASYTFGAQVRKFVLPLPVAVGDPIHITRDESRRSLDLPVNCSLALFLGRVNYKKGLPLLLEALNMPVLSSVHLAIAGRGEPS
jgi:glycosyltransferase involved in cell wall biosynthesis